MPPTAREIAEKWFGNEANSLHQMAFDAIEEALKARDEEWLLALKCHPSHNPKTAAEAISFQHACEIEQAKKEAARAQYEADCAELCYTCAEGLTPTRDIEGRYNKWWHLANPCNAHPIREAWRKAHGE